MTKLETMNNDQMTEKRDLPSSSFGLLLPRRSSAKAGACLVIRHSCIACRAVAARRRVIFSSLILTLIAQLCSIPLAQTQSPSLLGRWNVDITFANEEHRSLRFDVQGAGKGTFLLLDPKARVWGGAKPSEAKWTRGEGNSVTFSGPVEFMLGNVGRDTGTLVFKGKFETESLIAGEVEFSPLVGDRPSKSGTFKAIRAAGGCTPGTPSR